MAGGKIAGGGMFDRLLLVLASGTTQLTGFGINAKYFGDRKMRYSRTVEHQYAVPTRVYAAVGIVSARWTPTSSTRKTNSKTKTKEYCW